jgi:hypothetical protein
MKIIEQLLLSILLLTKFLIIFQIYDQFKIITKKSRPHLRCGTWLERSERALQQNSKKVQEEKKLCH